MKRASLLISFLLFTSGAFAGGIVETTSFYSNALGEVRELNVYLPEGYDPNGITLYPVVYFLHGADQNHFSYLTYLIDNMDNLIANQMIHPTILVMPEANNFNGLGSWYVNSELFGNFEDYIVHDIVEFIDTNYSAFPSREKRGIMGHSMGGFGCMQLALKHPDIYGGVASLSGVIGFWSFFDPYWVYSLILETGSAPPYNWDPGNGWISLQVFNMCGALSPNLNNPPHYVDFILDPDAHMVPSVVDRWDLHNPPSLAHSLPPYPELSIYFDCGTEDEFMIYPGNVELSMTLDGLGIPHKFLSYTGDHKNKLAERVPIAMGFLDSAMNQKGKGSGPVVYVKSQGLYYDSVVTADPLPPCGPFQLLDMGGPHGGLQTEFGPGDEGYAGGRMMEDFDGNGTVHYLCCPLIGPGRADPWH